jgi:hypothetical protein
LSDQKLSAGPTSEPGEASGAPQRAEREASGFAAVNVRFRELELASMPLSTRLFPYVFIASRRMSLRAMSGWLETKHGVSLSPAAISRALANPKLHLERLAESIAAPARYVAAIYGRSPENLLYGTVCENGPSELEVLSREHSRPRDEKDVPLWSELQDLAEVWEPIPHEVKMMLRPYLIEEFSDPDSTFPSPHDPDL